MKTKVEEAMGVLKQAMKDDPDYAWGWLLMLIQQKVIWDQTIMCDK